MHLPSLDRRVQVVLQSSPHGQQLYPHAQLLPGPVQTCLDVPAALPPSLEAADRNSSSLLTLKASSREEKLYPSKATAGDSAAAVNSNYMLILIFNNIFARAREDAAGRV